MSRELPRQIEVPVDRQERQLPRDLKPPYLTRQTLELVTALKAAEGGAVGELGEWRGGITSRSACTDLLRSLRLRASDGGGTIGSSDSPVKAAITPRGYDAKIGAGKPEEACRDGWMSDGGRSGAMSLREEEQHPRGERQCRCSVRVRDNW